MTPEQFNLAIDKLLAGDLKLPYGFHPGSRPGGSLPLNTQGAWDAYEWNPPQYLKHLPDFTKPDPDASAKPTWDELETASGAGELDSIRSEALFVLDEQATARITAAYGARNFDHEVMIRLSGKRMTNKNRERDRLKEVHDALKTRINAATTVAEIEAIDVTSDSVWAAS